MLEKTKNEYLGDIKKQLIDLNNKKAELITSRKFYTDSFLTSTQDEKEKYKNLLANVDNEREQVKKEAAYLRKAKDELENATIFDRNSIFQVIAYIVSVIEGQEYQVHNQELPFYDTNENQTLYYNFSYLAPNRDKKECQTELDVKYPSSIIVKDFDVDYLFKGENYIGIALFKSNDSKDIVFGKKLINHDKKASFVYVNDQRFNYINDFISEIINYRAYMNCEFGYPLNKNLGYEELYNLANDFLDKYQRKTK